MPGVALSYLSHDLAISGYLERATSRSEQAVAFSRNLGHVFILMLALQYAGWLKSIERKAPEALSFLDEALALATEHRFPGRVAKTQIARAELLAETGDPKDALALARRYITQDVATGARYNQTGRCFALAVCCERADEIDEALDVLDQAIALAHLSDERYLEPELHRVKGEWLVAHRQGHWVEAEKCLRRAITMAGERRAKLWELRAATSLARLWRDQGKIADAQALVAPIYNWFTEGFDAPDLIEAKSLLDELAAR